ncbi:hypothetical protein HDV05_003033 [Chytridiales sp. JEL 0842]|nr:hypothetical protein HDV05_003033 [Chytridiales sp. JEL 0842]
MRAGLLGAIEVSSTDWEDKYCQTTGCVDGKDLRHDLPYDHLVHVIILPNYKEEVDTLCETLDVLASHERALTQYKVCLAMEASEQGSEEKAMELVRLYQDRFREIVFTLHPAGLEGEIRGKSSNVAWASRQMAMRSGPKAHKYEIITVMDADTCFAADYFTCVGYHYCVASAAERKVMMFSPSTIFDRNASGVNFMVRITDIMWSIGVMSNLYPASPVKFPCSAYSVSMDLACAVGFWDASPEAIGEDMHMYLKCFFGTEGKVIIKTIYSPASQCNIEGTGSFWSGVSVRYTQAKRHLWGCLDSAYALRRTLFSILTPRLESAVSESASTLKDKADPNGKGWGLKADQQFALSQLLVLFGRLFEAHIALGHFFVMMLLAGLLIPASENPSPIALAYWKAVSGDGALTGSTGVHPIVVLTMEVCGWMRFFFLVPMIFLIRNYEKYHQWVGFDRWAISAASNPTNNTCSSSSQETSALPLAPPPPPMLTTSRIPEAAHVTRVPPLGLRAQLASPRGKWSNLLDWLGLPVAGLMFQGIPQCVVQLSQLWTDRLDYAVASKPVLHRHHPHPQDVSPSASESEPLTDVRVEESSTSEQQYQQMQMPLSDEPSGSLTRTTTLKSNSSSSAAAAVLSVGRGVDSGFFEMDEATILSFGSKEGLMMAAAAAAGKGEGRVSPATTSAGRW